MSDSEDGGGGPGRREVAWRVFAAEYDDATHSYSEGDEERAPNYVVTPTGARVNRLFVVGVLTAVEAVSEEVVRARVVDPTGAFVVYAGQYQPDALAFLERADTPAFVAVTGKARTFQPEDSDVVYTSIRPESINEVDAETRDRWVVTAAEHTLDRVGTFAAVLDHHEAGDHLERALRDAGVGDGLAAGVPKALAAYGTTAGYLAAVRDLSLDALRVVAGDVDEVDPLDLAPDEGGDAALDATVELGDAPVETATDAGAGTTAADAGTEASAETAAGTPDGSEATATTDAEVDSSSATATAGDDGTDESAASDAGESSVGDDGEAAAGGTDDGAAGSAEDAGDTDDDGTAGVEAGTPDVDDGEMYEFDEEEREEIEEEYGTEFATGGDIPSAGEADIGTPEPDVPDAADEGGEAEEAAADDAPDEESGVELAADEGDPGDDEPVDADEPDSEPDDAGDAEPADLVDAVVEEMTALDDGDGADRAALVDSVAGAYAVDADAVEDAVQDALMEGRCYEVGDGAIKPI